jgi:hypothetical protein
MDCRIFILTKGGDIAFTFQSPQFWVLFVILIC